MLMEEEVPVGCGKMWELSHAIRTWNIKPQLRKATEMQWEWLSGRVVECYPRRDQINRHSSLVESKIQEFLS